MTRTTLAARARRAGFTLVELLLAIGLLSILILALMRLLDTSLGIWGRADEGRELSELSNTVLDLLSEDLHALEGGPSGDLVIDWALFDTDRDGIDGAPFQRLRLVRHVDAAGLQRAARGTELGPLEAFDRGLVEVAWVLQPSSDAPDERALGTLSRGERVVGERETLSFFDPQFLGTGKRPVPGALGDLTGGVLWLALSMASQTTVLHDGWRLGDGLADCTASWDAWNKDRTDAGVTYLNARSTGMPQAKDVPLLPRRVRIEIELERPADIKTRTRLVAEVPVEATEFLVRDGRKVPERDSLILIDEEWMRVLSVSDERVSVERARRGTRAALHPPGALVHHGWRSVREVAIDMTREDWDL